MSFPPRPILDNVLDAVGDTPLIRLDKISAEQGLKCNLLCKLEFVSSGGSAKDRIAKSMMLAAEKEGKLIPGKSVIIEPTSGNTGIGLAMAGAVKGYSVVVTMPKKISVEKEAILRALGAQVIRTPDGEPWDSPRSHMGVAYRLEREIEHGIILGQYSNVNNPLAHEHTTGPEIIASVVSTPSTTSKPSSMKVDAFISSTGTGGTVTGVSRAIKKTHNPDCIVIGVDPIGSILAVPDSLNEAGRGKPFAVEGIGYDFIPEVLSQDVADVNYWMKSSDEDAFQAVQYLMRKEGLLVGGSSGSALSGALAWLKTEEGRVVAETEGMNVVVLFADGIRNYMSKEWFLKNAFHDEHSDLAQQISSILAQAEADPAQ